MNLTLLRMMRLLISSCLPVWAVAFGGRRKEEDTTTTSYGPDVSFPIHRRVLTENNPLGDRQALYKEHLDGCHKAFPDNEGACDYYEYYRMLMNVRQPQSMKNYTETGFKLIRAPEHVAKLVAEFWEKNHDKAKPEKWPEGNSYVNFWDTPTKLVSVDDRGLRGSGPELKENVWAAASATLEEWTSEELEPCSLYGIRVYGEGAIMLPHVDRLPLVASAMLNVAQDVDEDWPLEIYDHDGNAHNVTMHPGDMLLFESHSTIHGHPFPLKGRYYASIFMHFEPTGHQLHHNSSGYYNLRHEEPGPMGVDKQYRESVNQGFGGQSAASNGDLPPYLKHSSPEEENWRREHPDGWKPPFPLLPPQAHVAAMAGQLDVLEKKLEENQEEVLTERDEKGWQVLHQGVAGGNKDVVELLVEKGADVNARTHGGYGETPLRIAEKRLGKLHPIVEYLRGLGALSLGPEL